MKDMQRASNKWVAGLCAIICIVTGLWLVVEGLRGATGTPVVWLDLHTEVTLVDFALPDEAPSGWIPLPDLRYPGDDPAGEWHWSDRDWERCFEGNWPRNDEPPSYALLTVNMDSMSLAGHQILELEKGKIRAENKRGVHIKWLWDHLHDLRQKSQTAKLRYDEWLGRSGAGNGNSPPCVPIFDEMDELVVALDHRLPARTVDEVLHTISAADFDRVHLLMKPAFTSAGRPKIHVPQVQLMAAVATENAQPEEDLDCGEWGAVFSIEDGFSTYTGSGLIVHVDNWHSVVIHTTCQSHPSVEAPDYWDTSRYIIGTRLIDSGTLHDREAIVDTLGSVGVDHGGLPGGHVTVIPSGAFSDMVHVWSAVARGMRETCGTCELNITPWDGYQRFQLHEPGESQRFVFAGVAPIPVLSVNVLDPEPTAGLLSDGGNLASNLDEALAKSKRDVDPIQQSTTAVVDGKMSVTDAEPTDLDSIGKYVSRKKGQLKACYEEQLKYFPDLDGDMVLSWSVMADGSVPGVTVGNNTTGSSDLESCCIRRIKRWQFAETGYEYEITYALSFRVE